MLAVAIVGVAVDALLVTARDALASRAYCQLVPFEVPSR